MTTPHQQEEREKEIPLLAAAHRATRRPLQKKGKEIRMGERGGGQRERNETSPILQ